MYEGQYDLEDAQLLDCYAAAYASADCGTSEGYGAATEGMYACAG
ncbi:MAG: hypothetical protein ACOZNI_03130 [Myxococcota bacterium]